MIRNVGLIVQRTYLVERVLALLFMLDESLNSLTDRLSLIRGCLTAPTVDFVKLVESCVDATRWHILIVQVGHFVGSSAIKLSDEVPDGVIRCGVVSITS